jgi:hypothetical protein
MLQDQRRACFSGCEMEEGGRETAECWDQTSEDQEEDEICW